MIGHKSIVTRCLEPRHQDGQRPAGHFLLIGVAEHSRRRCVYRDDVAVFRGQDNAFGDGIQQPPQPRFALHQGHLIFPQSCNILGKQQGAADGAVCAIPRVHLPIQPAGAPIRAWKRISTNGQRFARQNATMHRQPTFGKVGEKLIMAPAVQRLRRLARQFVFDNETLADHQIAHLFVEHGDAGRGSLHE